MDKDRPLPIDASLERKVLSMLMDLNSIARAEEYVSRLSMNYFTSKIRRIIYSTITALVKEKELPLVDTVMSSLDTEAATLNEFSEVVTSSPTSVNIEFTVNKFITLSITRKAMLLVDKFSSTIASSDDAVKEISALAEELGIFVKKTQKQKIFTTRDTIRAAAVRVKEASEQEHGVEVPYGISAIDKNIKLFRKQVHTIGARPSVGKTAFALSCMLKQAMLGQKTVFFCGESDREELLLRMASLISGIPIATLFNGLKNAKKHEAKRYFDAMKMLDSVSGNFFLYGLGDIEYGIEQMERVCHDLQGRHGALDSIYADHLQNMRPSSYMKKERRLEQVAENVRQFKLLNVEYNTAGTLLCQLNRESEKLQRPNLSSLKETSVIEEESHVVSFLHRKESPVGKDAVEVEWYSGKTRVIPPFATRLVFNCNNAEFAGRFSRENI